jgi:sugar diacid utilization regulator
MSQKVVVGVVFVAAVFMSILDATIVNIARALHIHPNTLLYRIRRFEQLSGRSLASTEALAEVWLAMRTTAAVPSG